MKTNLFNFTKGNIQKLPQPQKGISYFKDTKEKGLSLYITANAVTTFFIRKRINGKDERVIIGNFPDISVETARKQTRIIKGQVAGGINPNDEKRKIRQEITLGELFSEFMERYSKRQKRTWKDDEREMKRFLSRWFSYKISIITKRDIQLLHEQIKDNNGLYQANRLLERLRAMYNKAIEWGWSGSNPSNGIKKFKEKRRDRFIQPAELPRFFQGLEAEPNINAKDYIWILLLTGARKTNALAMRWEQIDWHREEWRIPDTKNGEPLTVPLVKKAIEILKSRRNSVQESEWVFPSNSIASNHFSNPKKAWARVLKRANITNLRIHDIRRTMGSYQAITGASLHIIGKSLGHKSQEATQIYARLHNDPIRASMEKATAAMLVIPQGAAEK
ncbi:MAG: recombinase XerD [Gammaproteobacteria bacterium GWE2_42_36]|nr:MAG: recombinase XerD [Gammaproteobacteria bacterium GWE2_42_36]